MYWVPRAGLDFEIPKLGPEGFRNPEAGAVRISTGRPATLVRDVAPLISRACGRSGVLSAVISEFRNPRSGIPECRPASVAEFRNSARGVPEFRNPGIPGIPDFEISKRDTP